MTEFDRITCDVGAMGGNPCLRGARVTVGVVVSLITAGMRFEASAYLQHEDIHKARGYAA